MNNDTGTSGASALIDQVNAIRDLAIAELAAIGSEAELDAWRVRHLGKRGSLSDILRGLGALTAEERPRVGQASNAVKDDLESALAIRRQGLVANELVAAAERDRIDVTLPGRPPGLGQLHLVTRTLREIIAVFTSLGFRVAEGPEVELDYYNFEALNIPADHPARDMWDTFYVKSSSHPGKMLMRTHTSPMQVRVMEQTTPPIRVLVPGKTYRYEAVDATHESMFHQVEGLAVDRNLTMADLKGTLETFAHAIFGFERRVLFYCAYFPFVEPGVEVAIDCHVCRGKGCRLCKGSGWIEIMGAGMVHPKVLAGVGYDPAVYSGFAFGMGPERVAMLKYGIDDIRLFFANDLRFLRQFK
ncbi:MAG TPA: phenylalanine--tRNA ligase subunit alpha [Chloroflexota bacterium]|nr:phenylalanine--tRNA ligase subunit alpha [Chloroflexota bacterium]